MSLLTEKEVEVELAKWPIGGAGAIRTGARAQQAKNIAEIEALVNIEFPEDSFVSIREWIESAKKETEK